MSFVPDSVPNLVLFPSSLQTSEFAKRLPYRRLILWLYRFPQALETYLAGLASYESTDEQLAKQGVLTRLTERTTLIGVLFFWLLATLYSVVIILYRGDFGLWTRWFGWGIVVMSILCGLALLAIIGDEFLASTGWRNGRFQLRHAFITNIVGIAIAGGLVFVPLFDEGVLPSTNLTFFLCYISVVIGFLFASAARLYLRSQETAPVLNIALVSIALLGAFLISMLLGAVFSRLAGFAFSAFNLRQIAIALAVGLLVCAFGTLRLDDWLWAQLFYFAKEPKADEEWPLPHVTLVPYLPIGRELKWQLKINAKKALDNGYEIMEASYQKHYIMRIIREFLAELDGAEDKKKLVDQVMVLATSKWGERQYYFALAPNAKEPFRKPKQKPRKKTSIKELPQKTRLFFTVSPAPEKKRKPLVAPEKSSFDLSVDTPSRAAMAGIWHLMQKNPKAAVDAFKVLSASDYGDELLGLSIAFVKLLESKELAAKPELELAKKPDKPKHEEAWKALDILKETVRLAWFLKRSRREDDEGYRAELQKQIIENMQTILANQNYAITEKDFLHAVAQKWQDEFSESFWDERDPKLEPIAANPYAYAEAFDDGRIFVGRKAQLSQLTEAWRTDNFQNVLLYGQRRSGRTSLLHKADLALKDKVDLIHINLAQTVSEASFADLFMDITSVLDKELSIPAPAYGDMMISPMRTFREYIFACSEQFGNNSLAIVFDNFEQIEQIFPVADFRNRFLHFLMHVTRQVQNVGFVCVAESPPDEFKTRFDDVFTASLTPIPVQNFQISTERGDVEKMFRNPTPQFMLHYLDDTIDGIFALTGGNPYLLQVMGYYLVTTYNQDVKDRSDKIKKKTMGEQEQREPVLTIEDVATATELPGFKNKSERYFVDLMEQVGRIRPLPEEQERRKENASQNLDYKGMLRRIARDEVHDKNALSPMEQIESDGLVRHGIVEVSDSKYVIPVRLLRDWLRQDGAKINSASSGQ